jgi:hypothetical protein
VLTAAVRVQNICEAPHRDDQTGTRPVHLIRVNSEHAPRLHGRQVAPTGTCEHTGDVVSAALSAGRYDQHLWRTAQHCLDTELRPLRGCIVEHIAAARGHEHLVYERAWPGYRRRIPTEHVRDIHVGRGACRRAHGVERSANTRE